jgi:1,2-diacylglycerol 3-alpha-glucosyltransferase
MRIGIVTNWGPCGAGVVSKQYFDTLSDLNDVFVYARDGVNRAWSKSWLDSSVTPGKPHYSLTGIQWSDFKNWIKRCDIDTLIFNEQRYWSIINRAKKYGLKVGGYVDYYTQETVPLFACYDFLLCNTKRHLSVFEWHPGAIFIPWGVGKPFRPPRQSPSRDATEPVVFLISAGWNGRMAASQPWMDRRGVGVALRAFQKVQGNCRLVVLSQNKLRECPLSWQAAVANDRRIEFLEGTFEPTPYHLGSVYVYPFRLDGIGLTVPEALWAGLPVIATDAAPINEFVRHGVNGSLAPVIRFVGRPDGYYWPEGVVADTAIANLMSGYVSNPQLVADQRESALEFAKEHLDWERNTEGLSEKILSLPKSDISKTGSVANEIEKYDRWYHPTLGQGVAAIVRRHFPFKSKIVNWRSRFRNL